MRITPMFGRWGSFVGDDLFACFLVREKDHGLWIRLTRQEQAQALSDPRVRPTWSRPTTSPARCWLRRSYRVAIGRLFRSEEERSSSFRGPRRADPDVRPVDQFREI